jgi:hypothetical protein
MAIKTKAKRKSTKKPASAKQLAARALMKTRMKNISALRLPGESMQNAVKRYFENDPKFN